MKNNSLIKESVIKSKGRTNECHGSKSRDKMVGDTPAATQIDNKRPNKRSDKEKKKPPFEEYHVHIWSSFGWAICGTCGAKRNGETGEITYAERR